MSTRSRIPRRKRIFFGCEGASVRSLVTWLGRLCDESGLHLHLDQYDAGGGDGQSVIRRSVNERKKRIRNDGGYYRSIVLLDSDRLETDRQAGRDPLAVAKGLTPVWMRPNLEGLLIRLHYGNEARETQGMDVLYELQRLWPSYRKSVSAAELHARFCLDDLRRAARHDDELKLLLEIISLA